MPSYLVNCFPTSISLNTRSTGKPISNNTQIPTDLLQTITLHLKNLNYFVPKMETSKSYAKKIKRI